MCEFSQVRWGSSRSIWLCSSFMYQRRSKNVHFSNGEGVQFSSGADIYLVDRASGCFDESTVTRLLDRAQS
jgi:hypothetical protein